MTAPNLPRVFPSAAPSGPDGGASGTGPARLLPARCGPRLMLRGLFVGLALLLLVVLLTGCGNALPAAQPLPSAPPPSATGSPSPSPSPETSAMPETTTEAPETTDPTTSSAPPSSRERSTPPTTTGGANGSGGATQPAPRSSSTSWPASDAASAKKLQKQVDQGGEPWLLDPEEVTISYAGAVLNYRNPSLTKLGTGIYAVSDGRSTSRSTVTLQQTVRKGDGGIWLVTKSDRD